MNLPATRTASAEHVSRNAMFWRPDARVDEARRHHGWNAFHRQCGRAGLYFDDIEAAGRGYSCITFRLEKRGDGYVSYLVAKGAGRTVMDAVLSGFDESVAAGWPVPAEVRELLTAPPPRAAPVVPDISDDDLLGGPVAVTVDDTELV